MSRRHGMASVLILAAAASVAQEPATDGPRDWPAPLLWRPAAGGSATTTNLREIGPASAESISALPTAPLPLIGITPCRIADTRDGARPAGYGPPALTQGVARDFTLTGQCGIAATARAVSLNVTVTNTSGPGFILIYPEGGLQPLVSTLNYAVGQTVANAAVVPLGTGGGITVVAGVSGTDLILDTNGYYDNSALLTSVLPGTGLFGGGSSGAVTLGIAPGGVTANELAANAVTGPKLAANSVTAGAIAPGQVVKSVNGLMDGVTIAGSGSVTVNTSGSTVTVGGAGAPQGSYLLGKPGDTTLVGAGYTEVATYVQDLWAPTSTVGAPSGRVYHTAVWTGSKMIVWGGTDFAAPPFNTGGIYDPVTDTWTATSTASAPSGRYGHTAVWTGTRMLVWSGRDFVTTFDTGGLYDPVGNSWTATPTAGGPSGRTSHTAVWDAADGVMLVWGGIDGGGNDLNDGGRLNVGLASWGLITTLNAPSARWGHTAVWTGTQMIVWGGVSSGISVNTGGRYTLATFSWSPVGIDGYTPTARLLHTAVWTGTRMLVWGGNDSGQLVNTGGVYDPVGDAWSLFSTVGAPTGRSGHTAVWTGKRMVVWGGSTSATGGQYDPDGPSWTPTTTAGAPTGGRVNHTAVWTGSKMILWGGGPAYPYLSTGALWSPLSLYVKN